MGLGICCGTLDMVGVVSCSLPHSSILVPFRGAESDGKIMLTGTAGLSLKGVYSGAYVVLGASALTSIWLAFFF